MSLLKALRSDDSIAAEKDSIGGNAALESGLYPLNVALAYLETATTGAMALVLSLKTQTGSTIRQKLWMVSGKDKGNKNYYEDKDGAKHYLPGFNLANSLALLTVGKELSELDTEEKVINVYSSAAKAEVPTKVAMVTALLGQDILAGVLKQTVDKTQKNDAGVYIPTGDTRDENEIDKFFRARDRMTTAEIRAEATEAAFADAWEGKNTGVTRNKAKGAGSGNAGTAGAPRAAGGAAKKPAVSLFA